MSLPDERDPGCCRPAGLAHRRRTHRHAEQAGQAEQPDTRGCGTRWRPSATTFPTRCAPSSSGERASRSPPASTSTCSARTGWRARSRSSSSLRAATSRSWRRSTATSEASPGSSDPQIVSVAAVHGYAIGAGFQLALACDLRVVADDVKFCMKEPALGLVPDLAGTKPLVDLVGYSRALEICATARYVESDEARQLGIATVVVPRDELDATSTDLVEAVLANSCRGRPGDQGPAAGGRRTRPGGAAACRAAGTGPTVPRTCRRGLTGSQLKVG